MLKLDGIDIRILNQLQKDANISNVQLASLVGLSPSPCLSRVKVLKQSGLVKKQVVLLDPEKLGLTLNAYIHISLSKQSQDILREFVTAVRAWREVLECHLMTGESDYLLRVVVQNVEELRSFIIDRLTAQRGVSSIRSSISLEKIKYETAMPL